MANRITDDIQDIESGADSMGGIGGGIIKTLCLIPTTLPLSKLRKRLAVDVKRFRGELTRVLKESM